MNLKEMKPLSIQELRQEWNAPSASFAPIIQALKATQKVDIERFDANEIIQAIYFCKRHNINPLDNDIYFVPFNNKLTKIISIHWMTKKLWESGRVVGVRTSFDNQEKTATATIEVWNPKYNKVGFIEATVDLEEYLDPKKDIWRTKPKTMLKKVALAHACRMSGLIDGMNDVYLSEEMEQVINLKEPQPQVKQPSKMFNPELIKPKPPIIEEETNLDWIEELRNDSEEEVNEWVDIKEFM